MTGNNVDVIKNTSANGVIPAVVNAEVNPITQVVLNNTGAALTSDQLAHAISSDTAPVKVVSASISNALARVFPDTAVAGYTRMFFYTDISNYNNLLSASPVISSSIRYLKCSFISAEVSTGAAVTIYVYNEGGISRFAYEPTPELGEITFVLKFSLVPSIGITTTNIKSEFRGKTHVINIGIDGNRKLATSYTDGLPGYFKVAITGFTSAFYEKIHSGLVSKSPIAMQTSHITAIQPRTGFMDVMTPNSTFPYGKACVMHMMKASNAFEGHVYLTTDSQGLQPVKSFLYFPEKPDFMPSTPCEIATININGISYDVIRSPLDLRAPKQKSFFTIYLPSISTAPYT